MGDWGGDAMGKSPKPHWNQQETQWDGAHSESLGGGKAAGEPGLGGQQRGWGGLRGWRGGGKRAVGGVKGAVGGCRG